jgi:hypothetical protein
MFKACFIRLLGGDSTNPVSNALFGVEPLAEDEHLDAIVGESLPKVS